MPWRKGGGAGMGGRSRRPGCGTAFLRTIRRSFDYNTKNLVQRRPKVMEEIEQAFEAFNREATREHAKTMKKLVRERFNIEFKCAWLAIRIAALQDMHTFITDKKDVVRVKGMTDEEIACERQLQTDKPLHLLPHFLVRSLSPLGERRLLGSAPAQPWPAPVGGGERAAHVGPSGPGANSQPGAQQVAQQVAQVASATSDPTTAISATAAPAKGLPLIFSPTRSPGSPTKWSDMISMAESSSSDSEYHTEVEQPATLQHLHMEPGGHMTDSTGGTSCGHPERLRALQGLPGYQARLLEGVLP